MKGDARLPLLSIRVSGYYRWSETKYVRLYEQGADLFHIGLYVRHWLQWVRGGSSEKRIVETRKKGAVTPLPLGNADMVLLLSASKADSCESD